MKDQKKEQNVTNHEFHEGIQLCIERLSQKVIDGDNENWYPFQTTREIVKMNRKLESN
eukprot:m.1180077 g.1180077  ORF g.1180077 m.1180077 type:complete len:58 (-) comp24531_c0_seq1:248-421(-)